MRKNRKMPRKMSVIAERAMHVGAVIVMLFVMVILNMLASSSCTQLEKSIGAKEKMLEKLEESRLRESLKWDEMITPERLERHLVKHGLSMHLAKPAQNVRMRADGTPYPGQLSIVKADARVQSRAYAMAGVRAPTPVRTPVATRATAAARVAAAPRVAPVSRPAPVTRPAPATRTSAAPSAPRRTAAPATPSKKRAPVATSAARRR